MAHMTIIGGGVAGYTAALEAARNGVGVTLYEKSQMGGLCLNRGCIPTKTLLEHIHLCRSVNTAVQNGVFAQTLKLDWQASKAYAEQVIAELTYGLHYQLKKVGIEIRMEEFTGALEDDYIVYAQGAGRLRPHGLEACTGRVVDVTELLELEEIPKQAAIIGGGVTGVECAQILHAFGAEVTIYEKQANILQRFDQECVAQLEQSFRMDGITVQKNASLADITEPLVVCCAGAGASTEANGKNTFTIGDCSANVKLASDAMWEAKALLAQIVHKETWTHKISPGFAYTDPAIACAGQTEEEARANGFHVKSGYAYGYANGRAKTMGVQGGMVKTLVDEVTGGILGIHLLGPYAEELLGEAVTLIELGCTAEQLKRIIHPHPSICEMLVESVSSL